LNTRHLWQRLQLDMGFIYSTLMLLTLMLSLHLK
jgi:hypothetical protein